MVGPFVDGPVRRVDLAGYPREWVRSSLHRV